MKDDERKCRSRQGSCPLQSTAQSLARARERLRLYDAIVEKLSTGLECWCLDVTPAAEGPHSSTCVWVKEELSKARAQ